MGIFSISKLKIRKDTEGDTVHMYVNYYRQRKNKDLMINFINDMAGGNPCLFVVDTKYMMKMNKTDGEKNIQELTDALDRQSIRYEKLITEDNSGYNFMGFVIKRKDSDKDKNYIVGMAAGAEELGKLKDIIDRYNTFCYMGLPDLSNEELIKIFSDAQGDVEELRKHFKYSIFSDRFLCQFRFSAKEDGIKAAEEIIQKYN